MTAHWPPTEWDESDHRRDIHTRLPTALYPFMLDREQVGDKLTDRLVLRYDARGGTKVKALGTYPSIFPAFRAMLDAYEAWLPNRPMERVYFIGSELRRGAMLKVGFSTNPQARLKALQTASGEPLQIFATRPGGRDLEAEYHRRWHTRRKAGEWFVVGDCIIKEIERLSSPVHIDRGEVA